MDNVQKIIHHHHNFLIHPSRIHLSSNSSTKCWRRYKPANLPLSTHGHDKKNWLQIFNSQLKPHYENTILKIASFIQQVKSRNGQWPHISHG